jgi:hypothetical protein
MFVLDITTPPLYGPGTLPLVVIDFLPSTGVYAKWRLWRASFGVFTGNGGTVYVIRCDFDDGAALEDALAAEQSWGTEGLDFPTGSSRPSRACSAEVPHETVEDEFHCGDDGEWYDLSYAALREVNPDDLDYEASMALALAILRRGIEESDDGYIEVERDRVTVGPFEIALPPGVKDAHVSFDFDAYFRRVSPEKGWSTLIPFLIASGIELAVTGERIDGTYRDIFVLADERSCSGPALTEKGE